MLTADHVRAAADSGVVSLKKLHGLSAPKALALAERLVTILRAQRGASMRQLTEAFTEVPTSPREVRMKDALIKLLLDGSELSATPEGGATERRLRLFRAAAADRKADRFDRAALLAAHDVPSEDVEGALYNDLPEHRVLLRPSVLNASTLIEDFDKEQARALLLSARTLTVMVPRGSLRRLVARARFLGLIPTATERGEETVVTLEGPASKLEGGARYGLAFANFFPELEGLPRYRLEAEVQLSRASRGTFHWQGGTGIGESSALPLREPVAKLAEALRPHFDDVQPASALLIGHAGHLVVPDLTLTRGARSVHLELLEDGSSSLLAARLAGWPNAARDLIVCWKPAKTAREPSPMPGWLFTYRRILATLSFVQFSERFFD